MLYYILYLRAHALDLLRAPEQPHSLSKQSSIAPSEQTSTKAVMGTATIDAEASTSHKTHIAITERPPLLITLFSASPAPRKDMKYVQDKRINKTIFLFITIFNNSFFMQTRLESTYKKSCKDNNSDNENHRFGIKIGTVKDA